MEVISPFIAAITNTVRLNNTYSNLERVGATAGRTSAATGSIRKIMRQLTEGR